MIVHRARVLAAAVLGGAGPAQAQHDGLRRTRRGADNNYFTIKK